MTRRLLAPGRVSRVFTLVSASLLASFLVGCGGSDRSAAGYPMAPSPMAPNMDASKQSMAYPASAPAGDFKDTDAVTTVAESSTPKKGFGGAAPPAPPAGAPMPGAPPPPPPIPQASQPSPTMKTEKDATQEPAQSRDLVIYTARFTMAVYQVDQGLSAVEKIAKDNGGYLDQKKDREITIRIPRARFEMTLAAVDKIGDVLHREIQAQDVTDEHVDLEIRIKNARAMQRRLSDLLAKANVKEALEIEKELHRVTEELERLEGRMKVLKDKIAFSTLTVAFEPRNAAIATTRARLPFAWLRQLNLPSLLSLTEDK